MISNNVKHLVVALWIATLFTAFNGSAFYTMNPTNWCYFNSNNSFPTCNMIESSKTSVSFVPKQVNWVSDYSDYNTLNYFGLNSWNGRYYTIDNWENTTNWYLKSYNDGDYLVWRYKYNSSSSNYNSFQYNFINLQKQGDNYVFYWWFDLWKKYNDLNITWIPSLPNLNWTIDSFEYVVPWHWTWIFYNAWFRDKLKTIQYIWNTSLENKIIYVDSLASNDNIWVLDIENMEARSYTESDIDIISAFAFGSITDNESLNRMPRTSYYHIVIQTWGISFLPQTYWNFAFSNAWTDVVYNKPWLKSSNWSNIWLNFDRDYDYKAPNFWGWGSSGSGDNSMDRYNKCVESASSVELASNYQSSCINTIDGEHTTWANYNEYYNYIKNYSWIWTYTWLVRSQSCMDWINYTTWQFSSWGANYSLWFNYASDRANGVEFDVQDYCSRYLPNWVNTEQGWLCEYMCIGCDNYSVFGSEFITGAVSCMKEKIVEPIASFTWYPISDSFMSWYNYFGVANSCNEDLYWKSYSWWNFLIAFIVGWLVIAFYTIFK